MEEQKINEVGVAGQANVAQAAGNLPSEVSVWGKVKAFLLQDVNREIEITMTPYQEKVFKEVHDFWFQDITWKKVKGFLFKEIEITL